MLIHGIHEHACAEQTHTVETVRHATRANAKKSCADSWTGLSCGPIARPPRESREH